MTSPTHQEPAMPFPEQVRELEALLKEATPAPWRYEAGGGHAYNGIYGSDSIQTLGWPERRLGFSNASYTDRICENLGDINLPGPSANARLIAAAPEAIALLIEAVREYEAALKNLLSALETHQRHTGNPILSGPLAQEAKDARAALTKWGTKG